MIQAKRIQVEKASEDPFRRTGIANGSIDFPEDFDEQFDDLNEEIADMFCQEEKDVYRQRRRDIGADKKSSHCL